MQCHCGTQAEYKVFSTFEYWFCPKCKVDVNIEDGVEFIKIEKVEQLKLDVNEVLVVTIKQDISLRHLHQLRKNFQILFPHNKVIVLKGDIELKTVKQENRE